MRNVICLKYGTIMNNMTGIPIERPAILIDKSTGCIHGWGNSDVVTAKFINAVSAYVKAGMQEMADDLMVIDMTNTVLSTEQKCYLLKRCVEYTASGFQTELVKIASGTTQLDNIENWLTEQMKRVPIDLEEDN